MRGFPACVKGEIVYLHEYALMCCTAMEEISWKGGFVPFICSSGHTSTCKAYGEHLLVYQITGMIDGVRSFQLLFWFVMHWFHFWIAVRSLSSCSDCFEKWLLGKEKIFSVWKFLHISWISLMPLKVQVSINQNSWGKPIILEIIHPSLVSIAVRVWWCLDVELCYL